MKKITAILISFIMIFGLNVNAYAGGQGSIWTTNSAGESVDQNIYSLKADVYLNGGPTGKGSGGFTPGDQYFVRVLAPGGKILGMSTEMVTVDQDGTIPPVQLSSFVKTASSNYTDYGYDDTSNSGGEYQVEIGTKNSEGNFQKYKSDNFKVDRGTITITKDVLGEDNDPNEFEVLVEGVNAAYSKTYIIKEGSNTFIEGLLPGTYRITEKEHYGYTTQAPNPKEITIGPGSWAGYVSFTNIPNPPPPPGTGRLTIYKNVDNVENDETEFDITIAGPNQFSTAVKIKEGSPAALTGLLEGDYTVTEAANPEYTTTLPNPKIVHIGGDVESSRDISVTFVNTRNLPPPPGTGQLTINKDVNNVENDGTEFDVTIAGPNQFSTAVKIKEGSPATLTGLLEGDYTVTEAANPEYTTTLPNPKIVHIGGEVESSWNVSITFVNTKNLPPPPRTGQLTINKDVNNVENDTTEFVVDVTGPDFSHSYSIKEGAPTIVDGLSEGNYTITERAHSGYTTLTPNPVVVTIGGETEASWYKSVTFTNTKYVNPPPPPPPTGSITIYKDVNNVDNDSTGFQVQITGPESTIVTISEGSPAIVNNLPAGTYTLTELASNGYTIVNTNPVSVVIGQTVWDREVTFVNQKTVTPPEEQVPAGPANPVVTEEPVPGAPATLPNTGEPSPTLFYLAGAAVISLGTILKRKHN